MTTENTPPAAKKAAAKKTPARKQPARNRAPKPKPVEQIKERVKAPGRPESAVQIKKRMKAEARVRPIAEAVEEE